jgi:hypothetical protein
MKIGNYVGISAVIAIFCASLYGWIANLVKLWGMLDGNVTGGMMIGRAVGVFFAPLGAFMGYM